MASVVFMRGVNVGRHKRFRPGELARALTAFGAVNVGAAGTFVIRKPVDDATLRAQLLQRLPFDAEIMICRASDLIDLAGGQPFRDEQADEDARRFVCMMSKRPQTLPRLPITEPLGKQWQVKVIRVSGKFALCLWRPLGRRLVYPNEVVEKKFGVPTTTRSWNTISTICKILEGG